MDDVKKEKYISIAIKIAIIVAFTILTFLIAQHHEHWSDEAQSFLLARDNSIVEVFKYIKYEGTPALWIFVIKIFIFLGGTYETFFLLPIIFSVIGISIFQFKIDAPWYVKLLFPFTYFIFYQYTIIARSYCLVFPMLMLIASIYNKRLDKPILYSIILLLFMNISLHTLIISGSLYLLFIIDACKNKKILNNRIFIACVIIFIELLITLLYIIPSPDCCFNGNGGSNIFHIISEATIGSMQNIWVEILITGLILVILGINTKKKFINDIFTLGILLVPVMFVLVFITYQCWHVGIIFLTLFTYLIITNKINDYKIVKYFMLILCCIQIYWTISSSCYDLQFNYSASKDVAEFLEEKYNDKVIYSINYSCTAIEPYFDENIFKNRDYNKSFFLWRKQTDDYAISKIKGNKADIYVIPSINEKFMGRLLDKNCFDEHKFYGYTYIKDKIYESESYCVWLKK